MCVPFYCVRVSKKRYFSHGIIHGIWELHWELFITLCFTILVFPMTRTGNLIFHSSVINWLRQSVEVACRGSQSVKLIKWVLCVSTLNALELIDLVDAELSEVVILKISEPMKRFLNHGFTRFKDLKPLWPY